MQQRADTSDIAYQASLADIQAVPEAALIPITLDAMSVAINMFGILPRLAALRGQIAETWRDFDFERFDKLEQYGMALAHAHALHNRLTRPRPEVAEKAAELTRLRDRLYSVALPLVEFGLIDAGELAKCKVAIGYRPLIEDVFTLVGTYRANWAVLAGKTPLTEEDVLRAKALATDLMKQVGLRGMGPASVSEANLIRQKAFTLFINSYEEARRAVLYLRGKQGVLTPGSSAGEPLHILSALERRPQSWTADPEGSRAALSAAISLVLQLLGRDSDPAKSREHVLLAVLAERRLTRGQSAELRSLLEEVLQPPLERIGALSVNEFLSLEERRNLAAALNTLLASPTFASWRQGASLDIAEWLTPRDGHTPAVIVSVAHLDDDERALVLGVLLEEVLTYMRAQPGSKELRALIAFDEVYGILPPHPHNPPSKRPLVTLMKQGRAFGLGVLVSTQNPMDLDYRALSNAGFWAVGRLQTDADRARVAESLCRAEEEGGSSRAQLSNLLRRLELRWFLIRDAHASSKLRLLRPRWALSYLRGPMTPRELRRALGKAPRSIAPALAEVSARSLAATVSRSREPALRVKSGTPPPHSRSIPRPD